MHARRTTIMSHGGKHGVGGTYLQGEKIAPEDAPHLPGEIIGAAVHVPKARPAVVTNAPPQTPADAEAGEEPVETPKAEATPADAPVAPTAPPAPPPAAAAPALPVTPPKRRPGSIPTTRKGVTKLDRAGAVALAKDALGLDVAEGVPLEEVHATLLKGLSIE